MDEDFFDAGRHTEGGISLRERFVGGGICAAQRRRFRAPGMTTRRKTPGASGAPRRSLQAGGPAAPPPGLGRRRGRGRPRARRSARAPRLPRAGDLSRERIPRWPACLRTSSSLGRICSPPGTSRTSPAQGGLSQGL